MLEVWIVGVVLSRFEYGRQSVASSRHLELLFILDLIWIALDNLHEVSDLHPTRELGGHDPCESDLADIRHLLRGC